MPAANAVSYSCATPDEMSETLQKVLDGGFVPPAGIGEALSEVVADWFAAVDGKAAERVSARILRDIPRQRDSKLEHRAHRALYGLDASPRQRLAGGIRMALGISPSQSFRPSGSGADRWAKSEKFFGVAEVRRIATAIEDADGRAESDAMRVVDAASSLSRAYRYRLRSVAVLGN
jgi:hypothetical protein